MAHEQPVDFWFDPSCPYTWLASRWLIEAARVRPIEIRWQIMSLSVLNEGRDDDPEGDPDGYLWYPVRVCAAVERHFGKVKLGEFYTALGRRVHQDDPQWDEAMFPEALATAGLPAELATAAESDALDEDVRASHARGIELVGDHVGTPIIATERADEPVAFFGPVISRIPRGEAAGRLWDLVVPLAAFGGFHELKTVAPDPPAHD